MPTPKQGKIIAAVRTAEEFENAVNSRVGIIFHLSPDGFVFD